MTKKLLGLLIVGLFCITCINANTYTGTCNLTSGSNTVSSPANGSQSVFTGTFTCLSFTVPAGQTLTAVDLSISNDYSLGTQNQTNTVNFTYTISNFSTTALTTSVSGSGIGSVSSTAGGIVNQVPAGLCSAITNNTIDCTDAQSLLGGNTFASFTVTGTSSWVSGNLQLGGSDQFNVSAFFTYSSTQVTPEPASMLMIGSGLIGLALAGRRKWRA